MSLYNILVIGASGQVGSAIHKQLSGLAEFKPFSLSHKELDVANSHNLDELIIKNDIRGLINCAAYTAVDKAETDFLQCWKVNAQGPRNLALVCKRHRIPFIHFSTDYVYHNDFRRPLKETDPCMPKNVYGYSKLAGEQKAIFHHPNTIILRTSWVYAKVGNNFVNTIVELSKSKSEISVVNDQFGAPTWAADLAAVVNKILISVLSQPSNPVWYGIFNCSNSGKTSWFDFANHIIDRLQLPCRVLPVSSAAFIRPAQRPPYSTMDLNKLQTTFNFKLRDWQAAFDDCYEVI